MHRTRGILVASILAVAGTLATASQASATTFCAVTSGSLPDCTGPNTFSGPSSAVQNALTAAASAPGPDKVVIGSGTFTSTANSVLSYITGTSGNNVEIAGQGPSTVLQPTTTLGYEVTLAGVGVTSNSIHDLTVNIPAGSASGTDGIVISQNASADVHNVTISQSAANGSSVGVQLNQNSTLRDSTITLPINGSGNYTYGAISTATATTGVPVVSGSTLTADFGVGTGQGGLPGIQRLAAHRLRITATIGAYTDQSGVVDIDNSLIRMRPDPVNATVAASGVNATIFSSGNTTATVNASNLTIVGGSAVNDWGATAYASEAGSNVTVNLRNSVVHDVEQSLARFGDGGAANVNTAYTNYDPANVLSSNSTGTGSINAGAGNVNVASGFVNAAGGDYSLTAGSALVDQGDPAAPSGSESTVDLAGASRVQDGNGDCSARRDIGAFELTPSPALVAACTADTSPPNTKLGKFKEKVKAGKKAKFKFSSDDPAATFTCAYDNGSPKKCSSPYTLKRLKKGKHKLTITATDAAGNADPTPAVAKFKVKAKKKR